MKMYKVSEEQLKEIEKAIERVWLGKACRLLGEIRDG